MFRLLALAALISILHATTSATAMRIADPARPLSRAQRRTRAETYVPQVHADFTTGSDKTLAEFGARRALLAARRAQLDAREPGVLPGVTQPNIEEDIPASLLPRFIKDADYSSGGDVPPSQANPLVANARPEAKRAMPAATPA